MKKILTILFLALGFIVCSTTYSQDTLFVHNGQPLTATVGGVSNRMVVNVASDPAVTNLISNGTFDSTDDWVLEEPWSIGSGVLLFNNAYSEL